MALERIELRFSPSNPEEKALIDALEAQGDEYGAKGRFLKARLLRGYVAIMREVETIRQESDPLAALDRLAQSVNSGHYRVLRALLYQRVEPAAPAVTSAPAPSSQPSSQQDTPAAPAPQPVLLQAQSLPMPDAKEEVPGVSEQEEQAQPATPDVAVPAIGADTAEEGGEQEPAAPAAVSEVRTAIPNWSVFAGIAGKRGGGA